MTGYSDVFQAILAMDAYNRGYNPEITLPGTTLGAPVVLGTRLGDATIIDDKDDKSAKDISFYAVAYNLGGQTVISYRGTTFAGSPNLGDVLYGWTEAIGYTASSQVQFALDFYNSVKANSNAQTTIALTGHSLGGGLAAIVADLTGNSGAMSAHNEVCVTSGTTG